MQAHEQVRELLEEKDEGLTAFKEMEAAALRLQEDIIKRCAERDNLLERMSELEVCAAAPCLPRHLQKKSLGVLSKCSLQVHSLAALSKSTL